MSAGLSLNYSIANAQLKAGASKVNITNINASGTIHDSLYVRAIVVGNGNNKAVIISLDAVAIERIGSIKDNYLSKVRSSIQSELGIDGANVLVNASHLHGIGYNVREDVDERTIQAVKMAAQNMVPVTIGSGSGYEDRITQNHLLKLKNGKGWTIRHANPLPPDEEIESVGPIDPEIGILRIDKKNGDPLAVIYNFTGHPYQSVSEQTAGYPGFASKLIENSLGKDVVASFIQGFCGDVIPILYKDVHSIRDQEVLGTKLGLSTLEALKEIKSKRSGKLQVVNRVIKLPRRTDFDERIEAMEKEQSDLLRSLRGTSLNFKTFLPLYINYNIHEEYPSYYAHGYLHEEKIGREDLKKLDAENRRNIAKYLQNIEAMERLVRLQYNIGLVKERKDENESAGEPTIDVEIQVIKIGDFLLVTFPAEVSVQVGLNIKEASPFENTFVAGYTNGYIHYATTEEQAGSGAYQDHSNLLAPEWQKIFEENVIEILKQLK